MQYFDRLFYLMYIKPRPKFTKLLNAKDYTIKYISKIFNIRYKIKAENKTMQKTLQLGFK